MTIDVNAIKTAARGRWREILTNLGGIPSEALDGKHRLCPQCIGKDRFRVFDDFSEVGGMICNQCFPDRNGDGIAALQWLNGIDFQAAIVVLADYLGVTESASPQKLDPITRMAAEKRCATESLREYGATVDGDAVAFPAYGPDREQCTRFRVWPGSDGKRSKGLFDQGRSAGLFFPLGDQGPRFPSIGETWLIAEGVKDPAAYHGLGYLACGMNTDHLAAKFTGLFQGVDVILMPDRTADAEKKSEQSAALLVGVARSVKIAKLPLPIDGSRGDDARDVLKQHDGEQLLQQAIERAVPWMSVGSAPDVRRVTMEQAVSERLAEYSRGPIPRVELGIPKLDRLLGGGIPYGSFVVVGALSSHGKTAFALQATHHITREQREQVTFLSVEMGVRELADRTISFASDAPRENWHMLIERLEHDTKNHFADAVPCVAVEGLSTLAEIEHELVGAFSGGTRVAIVDYAQLIDAGSRDETNAIMRRVSATMKRLAKENEAIIVCLAQLNKRVEERVPLVPRLTDIEYGTKLEHDADVVLFLVWPHRIDNSKPPNEYQIFIEKNRNGRSKVAINCEFVPPRQRITEAEESTPDNYTTTFDAWNLNKNAKPFG